MSVKKKATTPTVLGILVLNFIVIVQPAFACTAGCTPGSWKQPQHFGYWTGYSSGDTVGRWLMAVNFPDLAYETLLNALRHRGGPGAEGAARILLREAVATPLISAYDAEDDGVNWGYGFWTVGTITNAVNGALIRGNRGEMLRLARTFDGFNNAGCLLEGQLW